jgi:hypothetical protein
MDLQRCIDRLRKVVAQARSRPTAAKRPTVPLRLESLEERVMPATVNAASVVAPVSTTQLGVNLTWWDDKLTTSQTQQMVAAAGLTAFRFPGGSSSDEYHFNVANNFGDSVAVTIPQFAQFTETAGGGRRAGNSGLRLRQSSGSRRRTGVSGRLAHRYHRDRQRPRMER